MSIKNGIDKHDDNDGMKIISIDSDENVNNDQRLLYLSGWDTKSMST